MYRALFISVLFLSSAILLGQKRNNVWYFGEYAGVTFNTTPPTTLPRGVFIQAEGVASICDEAGNLQFFTDGITIWDAGSKPMPNGTGLLGHSSSTQSALIVPKPGDCYIYYVFTVPSQDSVTPMAYSVVDMRLNNGKGDVVTKNVALHYPVTERLTATLQSNGLDYWVVTQEYHSNKYLAFSVTSAGVSASPVISNSGLPSKDVHDVLGYMKFSPDGSWLCYTSLYSSGTIEVLRFNNATGVVYDAFRLPKCCAYGVEFSPDNSKLYIATANHPFVLTQFDLTAGSPEDIRQSWVTIYSPPAGTIKYGGALLLGPDNKIYISRVQETHLGVINFPNEKGGACNFVDSAIALTGKCQIGLPNHIKSYSSCNITPQDTVVPVDSLGPVIHDPGFPPAGCGSCGCDVYIPNAFSPNTDNLNDVFTPYFDCPYEEARILIFDRWGEIIFETYDVSNGWNGVYKGKTVTPGNYFYLLQYTQLQDEKVRKLSKKGAVMVLD